MPLARILLFVPEEEGYGLYRYAADGEFAGDTWHETEREALEYASWAYGSALSQWKPIPNPVGQLDAVAMAALSGLQ